MTILRRSCLLHLAPSVLLAVVGLAQAPMPAPLAHTDSARGLQTLRSLPATTPYRVRTRSHSILYGRFVRAAGDSLVLSADPSSGREASIPLQDVTAVWYRHGTYGTTGFLLGAGTGIGLGLLIGSGQSAGDLGSGSALFATLLGCAGAIAGIVVGMNIDHYSPVPWPE